MHVLSLVREIRFVMAVLTVCAIAMTGFIVLFPERICETGGIYLDYQPPVDE